MPRHSFLFLLCLALTVLALPLRALARTELAAEGLLVICAAQDSTQAFRWEDGPGPGQLSLIWPEGRLLIPADLPLQADDQGDLGIPLQPGFGGAGPGGPVKMTDGLQTINSSLTFSDGRVHWMVQDGQLEILGNRLVYRRPWVGGQQPSGKSLRDQRANLLMIGGLLLLIAVLLRRARQKTRRKE